MGVFSPAGAPSPSSVTSTGSKSIRANQGLTLTTAGTEYEIVFPSGLKSFRLRIRGGGVSRRIQIASISGESGTNYDTLRNGIQYWEEGLGALNGFKLYVQGNVNGIVLEIITWT